MILNLFKQRASDGRKSLALLIDPDDINESGLKAVINAAIENRVNYFFVGGSLITTSNLAPVIESIKALSDIPCVLFPGNAIHIHSDADAILFLSLINCSTVFLMILTCFEIFFIISN